MSDEAADPTDPHAPTEPRSPTARLRAMVGWARGSRIAFAVWVAVVSLVAVPLVYSANARLGPGTISADVGPAVDGRTELSLPPLGTVRASTHRAPVRFGIELREIDLVDALGRAELAEIAAGADPVPIIEEQVRSELAVALRHMVLVLAVVAALCGAGAALAFPGPRSPLRVLAGALIGPVTIAALVGPAAIGFDPEEFVREPEVTGQLATADDLLARVASLETPLGSVSSRARILSQRIAGLYSAAITDDIDRSDGEVVLLHVSDLHLNTVGLRLAQDLARSFDVDAVVDTGDITSFGFEPEAAFVDLLGDFEVPYYVVAGNHDSEPVRRRLAESDDVISLDGDVVDIGGVRVLGIADPTVTALRRIPRDELDETYRAQFDRTAELVDREEPDLLLVHNPVQLRPVLGQVPAAAAGHLHRSELEVVDGTVVAVVGSSGATGVGSLIQDTNAPFRFELLRFVDARLVAVDHIELRGAAGDFVLERRLIDPEDPGASETGLIDEFVDEPPLSEADPETIERATSTTIEVRSSTTLADEPGP